ncbi:MAG: hypothetical protein ACXADD_14465 [Candidatus Thorarchaeota archaeon]
MAKDRIVNAVHEDDLEEFLESIGLLPELKSGQLRCTLCDDAIRIDEIAMIKVDRGQISFLCHKPVCRNLEGKHNDTNL